MEIYQLVLFISGIALAFAGFLFPKYKKVPSENKGPVMVVVNLVVFLGVVLLGCVWQPEWSKLNVVCANKDITELITTFIMQVLANQGTYLLFRKKFVSE